MLEVDVLLCIVNKCILCIPMTSTLATIDRDMMHNMGSLNALKSMHGHPSLVTNTL